MTGGEAQEVFGALRVVYKGKTHWACICECGRLHSGLGKDVKRGKVSSCGCSRGFGYRHLKAYYIWKGMLKRCNDPKSKSYHHYGGRGISVSFEWYDFTTFFKDMGEPAAGMTLERIDNHAGYCRANCKWATRAEQSRNTRQSRMYSFNGLTLCLRDWEVRLGVSRGFLTKRLRRMTFLEAVSEPHRYSTVLMLPLPQEPKV